MIVGLLIFAGFIFAVVMILTEFKRAYLIERAEWRMAELMHVRYNQSRLESLRDDLLKIKEEAIRIKFNEMDKIYKIERELNQLSVSLDKKTRILLNQGLNQPSNKGKVSYMLKLVDMSMHID